MGNDPSRVTRSEYVRFLSLIRSLAADVDGDPYSVTHLASQETRARGGREEGGVAEKAKDVVNRNEEGE